MDNADFFSEEFTPTERDLYDRQLRLDGWDQKIIKNSRVLIVGVGGIGCEVAKNLVMIGVGHLDLIDLDIIEHSNLNRQILFAGAKMGTPKATVAAKRLRDINPHITIKGYHTSLERLDPAVYTAADVVIGGLDSINARLNLNAHCIRFKKPLIDGGVNGYHGHMYTIFPYENACIECNPPSTVESDEMAACTVVGVPRKRIHCVFKGIMEFRDEFDNEPEAKDVKHIEYVRKHANMLAKKHDFLPLFTQSDIYKVIDQHDPGIITINAVISSLQSHETLKILHWNAGNKGLGQPLSSYMIFNAMTMKYYYMEKKRNPKCPQCGDAVRRISVKISRKTPCIEIINYLKQKGYTLDPDFDPMLTIMDFNNIKEVNLERNPKQNELRNLELLTVVGFKGGEIFL
ncbi:MAG: ThiF family adenylyltransferase, partial [Candidatus Helarchaeota archaeon]|nr:ThiF family adenylyltransferase [Candidatus Helarchaeota archaeon]